MKANVSPPKKEPYWWLSFVDTRKPRGEGFLGVVVTRSCCPNHAQAKAATFDGTPDWTCGPGKVCDGNHPIEVAYQIVDTEDEWRVEDVADRWISAEEVNQYNTEPMFPRGENDADPS